MPRFRTWRCTCAPRLPPIPAKHAVASRAADMSTRARFIYKGPSGMLLRRPKVYIILLTMMALWADGASGQGHSSGETFVAVRAGANLVGNAFRVRDTKPEPGAGVSIGRFLSRRWAVEFETWMRASNPECCGPRHTEMLYSV